jgi:hypothetical protein
MTRRQSLLLCCLVLFMPVAQGAAARAQTDPPGLGTEETDPGSPNPKTDDADPGTEVKNDYIPGDLPDSQSHELGWRLPPIAHPYSYYQANYGFNPPSNPADRLTTANRLKLFQYLTNGGQRGAALRTVSVPQLGSDLTFWWGLIEGMTVPWVSVNCNGTHNDPERNCPRCVLWQVGYGVQVQSQSQPQCALSDIGGGMNATYPGWSAQAIGSQVAWQAGSRWSFPNVSTSTLQQQPDAGNGTCGDPYSGNATPCNNRYWGSVLIRDPAVGAWLESAVSFPCYRANPPGWCYDPYYQNNRQRNSDWLAKVLNSWTDLANAGRAKTAGFLDQDTRLDGSGYDFDSFHTKASCWNGAAVLGISQQNGRGKTALCVGAEGTDGRFSGQLTSFHHVPGDDRTLRRTAYGSPNDDWASGYWKLECNGDEYVSGVGQDASWTQGDNRFHGIACSRLATGWSPGRCNVRVFDSRNDRGDNPPMEDWDSGALKGQCATDEYVAGISVNPGNGAPHSLLCCR